MSEYVSTKPLLCDEVEPSVYLTPVFERARDDGLSPHHIDMSCILWGQSRRFVPISHVGSRRRRILDLEDENDALRKLLRDVFEWADSYCVGCELAADCVEADGPCMRLRHLRSRAEDVGVVA